MSFVQVKTMDGEKMMLMITEQQRVERQKMNVFQEIIEREKNPKRLVFCNNCVCKTASINGECYFTDDHKVQK